MSKKSHYSTLSPQEIDTIDPAELEHIQRVDHFNDDTKTTRDFSGIKKSINLIGLFGLLLVTPLTLMLRTGKYVDDIWSPFMGIAIIGFILVSYGSFLLVSRKNALVYTVIFCCTLLLLIVTGFSVAGMEEWIH